MTIVNIESEDAFNSLIKLNNLVVIHFYAPWADQCSQINELIESMSKLEQYKNVKFGKVVAEDFPHLSLKCFITAVPTLILFNKESNVARVDGVNPSELSDKINKFLLNEKSNESSDANNVQDNQINDRIKKLINQAPCMLFMKGNSEAPRCGFSRQIVQLLESHNADYETFDILQDNDIREGLKKYSNWPTYPQLYINGDLIGGIDIVSEMSQSGELNDILPKKSGKKIEEKLQTLISTAPCMLFMKGTKAAPRCGFSKAIVNLLNEQNVDYQTFDILEDNEVREELKKYSNWPTYPQLYVNGELIGGLDIVKEMLNSGELEEMVPKLK